MTATESLVRHPDLPRGGARRGVPDAPRHLHGPGRQPQQVAFFAGLLDKVRETPDWEELMAQGAFNTTALDGEPFREWLEREEARHKTLMQEAGFLAQPQ